MAPQCLKSRTSIAHKSSELKEPLVRDGLRLLRDREEGARALRDVVRDRHAIREGVGLRAEGPTEEAGQRCVANVETAKGRGQLAKPGKVRGANAHTVVDG